MINSKVDNKFCTYLHTRNHYFCTLVGKYTVPNIIIIFIISKIEKYFFNVLTDRLKNLKNKVR